MWARWRGPTSGRAGHPQCELPEAQRQPGDGREVLDRRRRGVGPEHFRPWQWDGERPQKRMLNLFRTTPFISLLLLLSRILKQNLSNIEQKHCRHVLHNINALWHLHRYRKTDSNKPKHFKVSWNPDSCSLHLTSSVLLPQFMDDEEFVDTIKGFSTVRKEHTMFTDTNLWPEDDLWTPTGHWTWMF